MKIIVKKFLWILLIMAVLLNVLIEIFPHAKVHSRLEKLPLNGFGFVGKDILLNEYELAIFSQTNSVKRIYQAGANRFILLAVDGGANRHSIHDPLYCFRGAGWHLTRSIELPIPGGQGKLLDLSKGIQDAEVIFWFTDGRLRHTSVTKLWWDSVLRRFKREADSDPILILIQPASGTKLNWEEISQRCPYLFSI